jgi:hypothetical protein
MYDRIVTINNTQFLSAQAHKSTKPKNQKKEVPHGK